MSFETKATSPQLRLSVNKEENKHCHDLSLSVKIVRENVEILSCIKKVQLYISRKPTHFILEYIYTF